MSKQLKNKVAVLALFWSAKGLSYQHKNNWATYTANKKYD